MLMPGSSRRLSFGDFVLDIGAYELRRRGRRVNLERRAMDLLIALVERQGQLVTRDHIVERLWGPDVFVDVNTGINTAVRKVRQALRDRAETPTFVETVPGKGYRFIAAVEAVAALSTAEGPPLPALQSAVTTVDTVPPVRARSLWRWSSLSVIGVVLVSGLAAWRLTLSVGAPEPAMELAPLTTLSGSERGGTLSPDGRLLAFTWDGENQDNWDIYVQRVGSPEVQRLTSAPSREIAPRWSPDGGQIAYVRVDPGNSVELLHVMSVFGGNDRTVSSLPVLTNVSWSIDGRYLLAGRAPVDSRTDAGIYAIPVAGGEARRITTPTDPAVDWVPELSPDGSQLAYASCREPVFRSNCHLYVLRVNAELEPVGPPRRLTRMPFWGVRGMTWSRDGASVIYGAARPGFASLWRVDAAGARPEARIETGGFSAMFPRVATSADRLVFTRSILDTDIYRLQFDGAAAPVARSSVFDGSPRVSPGGRYIAFCSTRSIEAMEVWIAASDGSTPRQLTRGPGERQCSPSWAPDGRRIAFESLGPDGRSSIWMIGVDDGTSRQMTTGAGDHHAPSWSRDGQWLYFSWDGGHGRDIWRVHVATGETERVTHGGSGPVARETSDGRVVLYQPGAAGHPDAAFDAPLMAQPLDGGASLRLIPCVMGTAFAVGRRGVYFVPCQQGPNVSVEFVDLATSDRRQGAVLEAFQASMPSGFEVSPDERSILYERLVSASEDLMVIENFR